MPSNRLRRCSLCGSWNPSSERHCACGESLRRGGAPLGPHGNRLLMLGTLLACAMPLWFVEPLSRAQDPMFGLTSWAIAAAIALGIGFRWRWDQTT